MRKLIPVILTVVIICTCFSAAFADSLVYYGIPADSEEFYVIGKSENTYSGVYNRMHIYLDLKQYPIPEPTLTRFEYASGEHEEITVLKNDDDSYDYIGYVCHRNGERKYIIWSWSGYHKDGSLIGMDTYYDLQGHYLGNIKRDYTNGGVSSSHQAPFRFNTGSIPNKE